MIALRSASLALFLLAALAVQSNAQEGCPVDLNRPNEVRDANKAAETSELVGSPEDKRKAFTRAVNLVTRDPRKVAGNQLGAQMVLGRALIDIAMLPDMPNEVRRGDIGFTTDPDVTINLLQAADSLLDIVETNFPVCKADTEAFRIGPYGDLVGKAVELYNAQQFDSAEVVVRRSLMIYDGYPRAQYAHNILGNLQQQKGDMEAAIASFRTTAELMKGDTSMTEDRKTTTVLVAQLMIDEAETADEAQRTAKMNAVVTWLQEYLQEFPNDLKAQSTLATAQLKSGDVAAARRLFDEMLGNPDRYTDINMLEAGVAAARANQNEFAAQLFEAGLKKNPYSRDGLFNLATVYSDSAVGKLELMPPVLGRLHALDPENPDNFQLSALYWQAKARELRPAAEGKDVSDPAGAAFKTANDSLLYYFEKYTEAPVKVSFSVFSHDEGRHVLAGQIDNRSEAEKNYTLKLEFLGVDGSVLETRDVAVEGVRAGGSKTFRVEIEDKPGVTAFRYAPFTP
jgi:tetratricopeptide (TPR) repeat protein